MKQAQAQAHSVIDQMPSPVGWLHLQVCADGVTSVHFADEAIPDATVGAQDITADQHGVMTQLKQELNAYFAGHLQQFSVPLAPHGTDFQQQVWAALRRIPYGETWSYRDLAQQVQRPQGYQAVGQANGRNPIGIIVPCHRVIQADGSLGGYAGGVDRKSWLLRHELRVSKNL